MKQRKQLRPDKSLDFTGVNHKHVLEVSSSPFNCFMVQTGQKSTSLLLSCEINIHVGEMSSVGAEASAGRALRLSPLCFSQHFLRLGFLFLQTHQECPRSCLARTSLKLPTRLVPQKKVLKSCPRAPRRVCRLSQSEAECCCVSAGQKVQTYFSSSQFEL